MRRIQSPAWLCAAALLLLAGGEARAQEVAVGGRVVEEGTGAAVAGASVRVLDAAGGAALTGRDGGWRLGALPAGTHRVRVEHVGYVAREWEVTLPPAGAGPLVFVLTPRPLPVDAVVVTAARRAQALVDVPVATELVTRAEIERSGATDLSAVLVERTGVAPEGGHPSGAGVMLQGLGSERVLVLLDGQPFIGRLSGKVDLSRIPTSMIERIEVVKGPQSTLYGSEAMGGVVNVITRGAERGAWSAGTRLAAGTQGRLDAAANLLGGRGPLAVLADLGRRTIDLAPGRADESGARAERWDALAKVRWSAASSLDLEASALLLDERQRWQSGQIFHFADNRQWGARLGVSWTRGRHRLAPTLYATAFDHLSRRATSPEPVRGTGERDVQRLLEAELLYSRAGERAALDAGLELRRDATVTERVSGGERTLLSAEPFVQLTLSGERWSLVPGARLSWNEQWGAHATPRIAALFRPTPAVALRASLGHGFRAPAFKELYMEFLNVGPGFAYAVRGNPGLRPEASTNLTASAEWSAGRFYLRGQVFRNAFEDFIETRITGDSAGVTIHTYGNIDTGTTRGAELEAGLAWRAVRAEAGYGYLEAVQESGEPLLGRPQHSGRLALSTAAPWGLRASVAGTYTGETPVRRGEAGVETREGFLRFDLRLARELPRGFRFALGADNTLDARPRDWPGYAPRHLYAALEWRGVGDGR